MEARPQTGRAHRPWTHRLVLMQVACDFTPGRRAMGGSEVGLQAQPRSGCLFVSWRSVLGNATRAANSCQPHPGTRPAPTTQLQAHGGGAGERAGCRPVPVSSALTCTSECDLPTCGSWEVTFPGPRPFSTSTFSTAWCQVKCSEYRFGWDSKPLPSLHNPHQGGHTQTPGESPPPRQFCLEIRARARAALPAGPLFPFMAAK